MIQVIEDNYNNTIEFKSEISEQIRRFLKSKEHNSKITASIYENDIRNFFLVVRGKNLESLTKKDLMITMEEMEDYYSYLLKERKLSVLTANRYYTSIKMCLLYLSRKGYIDNTIFLDIELASGNANSHGILTLDEVDKMSKLVLNHGNKETGLIKHYLIKFAVDTCARISECLSLKWSDFKIEEDKVRILLIAKGNKEFKPIIDKSFYDELTILKTDDSDYVFNIHKNTVHRMMKKLREEMSIPDSRKIVFHSLRKTGVDRIWKITRDINQARKAANHSSSRVTEVYIDTEEDYGVRGYYSSKNKVDDRLYKKVSHYDLIKAIDELDKGLQQHINLKLSELNTK